MKIKVFEAFAGYGSQMMALRRVSRRHAGGADFQLVGWSEIDDNAIAAHNAVFPEYAECNHGDISKVDWERVSDFDKEGINGRKPQDTSFTEAAIKMAEFCIENDLM